MRENSQQGKDIDTKCLCQKEFQLLKEENNGDGDEFQEDSADSESDCDSDN